MDSGRMIASLTMPITSAFPRHNTLPPDNRREHLFGWVRLAALWLPAVITVFLVKTHAVNVMLWDDWWLAEDWLKYLKGEFRWTDLFAVQMEHRLAVPRAIGLGLNLIFEGDVRAQNGIALLALAAIAAMMHGLLRKTLGPLRGGTWWIAFAMMAALFSPVQWQPLLWPIIFTVYLAMAFVVGAVLVWFKSGPGARSAFAVSLGLAILATLTFASHQWIRIECCNHHTRQSRMNQRFGAWWSAAIMRTWL